MSERYQADNAAASREVILQRIDRMEFIPVPVTLLRDPHVNAEALKTWCLIWAVSGREGTYRTTFRNKSAMAHAIGVSDRTFKRHMAVLRREGWIYDEPLDHRNPCSPTKVYVLREKHKPDDGELFSKSLAGATNGTSAGATNDPLGENTFESKQPTVANAPRRDATPWDVLFEGYPGRKKAKASRGKFFKLLKATGMGARDAQDRVAVFVHCYERLGWPLPELTHLLDPDRENLTDHQLNGLRHEAAKAKGQIDPALAAKKESKRNTDELRRLKEQAAGLLVAANEGNTRAAAQLRVVEAKIATIVNTGGGKQ